MAAFITFPSNTIASVPSLQNQKNQSFLSLQLNKISPSPIQFKTSPLPIIIIRCSIDPNNSQSSINKSLKTCKNCKTQFDPSLNHPRACRFHTAHFGGETKRKFESVYTGGTIDTPDSGKVYQYWHCCGSEDPFDPGCTATPHASYDD